MTPAQQFQALNPNERQLQIESFLQSCQNGSVEEIEALLDGYGMDLYRVAISDVTPLGRASEYNSEDVIRLLIKRGIPADENDSYGYTPMMRAIIKRRTNIMQALIDEDADINAIGKFGLTALFVAVMTDDLKMMDWVLSQPGLDIDHRNAESTTALLEAVKTSRPAMVRKLLEKGADMRRANKNGDSPLSYAEKSGVAELQELMQEFIEKEKRATKKRQIQQMEADFKRGLKKPLPLPPRPQIFAKSKTSSPKS